MAPDNSDAKPLTSSNHYLSALLEQAIKLNIDKNTLLRNAGIEPDSIKPDSIDQQSARIETEKIALLVQLMWDALQDENLGLSQFQCKPGTFYMMGKLTVHQPNLQKALALGIRFYNQFISGYTLSTLIDAQQVHFRVVQQDMQLDPKHLLTELILLAWHRYCSWLIGQNIPLQATTFSYPPPRHLDEYKFLFPSPHHFNHQHIGFSFNRQYLNYPTIQNDSSLKHFMCRCPAALFLRHHTDESVTRKVRRQLETKVQDGLPPITQVAKTLNMTTQTLRRKLKSEGHSYQKIKDLVRRDCALHHLSLQHLPISEVARLVNFSEPSVFIRAFKGWTGLTPGEYRNSLYR